MITPELRKKYQPTIGIECHVQLKTKTKLFAAVGNDARDAAPNTLVSHICFGLPGALPVLNREAIRLATRAAFALGTEPERFSKFDRKHYFYPDLPKGYQISQYDEPIIGEGSIDVPMYDEATKTVNTVSVGITRAHLEEDAGKSTHPAGADYSLVDLNRAGTPLLEIVSKPDMHSAAVAKAYAHELYLRMKFADVSDCDLYLGHMRFDVNVSVSPDDTLGTRTETKNLNSFRSVEKAIEYEIDRQIALLEKGERIIQETRGWDDAKQKTFSQRSKEEAQDYRYMPDPDIPPVVLDRSYIEAEKAAMPMLPEQIRQRLAQAQITPEITEDILDRTELVPLVLELINTSESVEQARAAVFRLLKIPQKLVVDVQQQATANQNVISQRFASRQRAISAMIQAGQLNSTTAQQLSEATLQSEDEPLALARQLNLLQVSDEGEIAAVVARVLTENGKAAEDVRNGEMKAIGFLVGQVMKLSKGKANPALATELIKKQLGL